MARAARRDADVVGVGALAAAGALVGHQIGYAFDADARAGHGHLSVVGPMVVGIAFVAAWAAAVRVVRSDPGRAPSWRRLAALQTAAFLVLEVGERVVLDADVGSLLSLPVLIGLVVQPFVALAALELVGVAGALIARFVDGSHPSSGGRPLDASTPAPLLLPVRVRRAHRRRGPPGR